MARLAMVRLARMGLLILGLALASNQSWALEKYTGEPILKVSGVVLNVNQGTEAWLDLEMLNKLPHHSFTTATPWHDSKITFEGVLVRDLLKLLVAKGKQIKASALNDYTVTIPFEDAEKFDLMIAYKINGKAIPIREKGPLFVIYPFDSSTELNQEIYYSRSIWQLERLKIE